MNDGEELTVSPDVSACRRIRTPTSEQDRHPSDVIYVAIMMEPMSKHAWQKVASHRVNKLNRKQTRVLVRGGLPLLVCRRLGLFSIAAYAQCFTQKLKPPPVWVTWHWHPIDLWLNKLCCTSPLLTTAVLLVWQGKQDDRLSVITKTFGAFERLLHVRWCSSRYHRKNHSETSLNSVNLY